MHVVFAENSVLWTWSEWHNYRE